MRVEMSGVVRVVLAGMLNRLPKHVGVFILFIVVTFVSAVILDSPVILSVLNKAEHWFPSARLCARRFSVEFVCRFVVLFRL